MTYGVVAVYGDLLSGFIKGIALSVAWKIDLNK